MNVLYIGAGLAASYAFLDYLQWRNRIVTKIRLKVVRLVGRRDPFLHTLQNPSHLKMMFTFHKWKFDHFYPLMEDYINESGKYDYSSRENGAVETI